MEIHSHLYGSDNARAGWLGESMRRPKVVKVEFFLLAASTLPPPMLWIRSPGYGKLPVWERPFVNNILAFPVWPDWPI